MGVKTRELKRALGSHGASFCKESRYIYVMYVYVYICICKCISGQAVIGISAKPGY